MPFEFFFFLFWQLILIVTWCCGWMNWFSLIHSIQFFVVSFKGQNSRLLVFGLYGHNRNNVFLMLFSSYYIFEFDWWFLCFLCNKPEEVVLWGLFHLGRYLREIDNAMTLKRTRFNGSRIWIYYFQFFPLFITCSYFILDWLSMWHCASGLSKVFLCLWNVT